MKNFCTFLFSLTLCACISQERRVDMNNLNELSKSFFINNFKSIDLSGLSEAEKCILLETVKNDMDQLNDLTASTVQSFSIRNFYLRFSQLHFSFVFDSKDGQIYFLALPELHRWINDVKSHYTAMNDSIYQLKEKNSLRLLNTPLLDIIFTNDSFRIDPHSSNAFQRKYKLASGLSRESFRMLYHHEVPSYEVFSLIEEKTKEEIVSKSSAEDLASLIREATRHNIAVETFYLDGIGFVAFKYSVNERVSKIGIDVYFLPAVQRKRYVRFEADTKYVECMREQK
jgi:hypothetical protein